MSTAYLKYSQRSTFLPENKYHPISLRWGYLHSGFREPGLWFICVPVGKEAQKSLCHRAWGPAYKGIHFLITNIKNPFFLPFLFFFRCILLVV